MYVSINTFVFSHIHLMNTVPVTLLFTMTEYLTDQLKRGRIYRLRGCSSITMTKASQWEQLDCGSNPRRWQQRHDGAGYIRLINRKQKFLMRTMPAIRSPSTPVSITQISFSKAFTMTSVNNARWELSIQKHKPVRDSSRRYIVLSWGLGTHRRHFTYKSTLCTWSVKLNVISPTLKVFINIMRGKLKTKLKTKIFPYSITNSPCKISVAMLFKVSLEIQEIR